MRIGYLMQMGAADLRRRPLSGPAVHIQEVIRELMRRGHQVRLLARMDGRIWQSDDAETFEPMSVPWLDAGPARWLERGVRRAQAELRLPYAAVFESVRFARACYQQLQGYDLLYERMGWMGCGGALAARALGVPLVLEVNGDHLSEMQMLGVGPTGLQRRLSLRVTKQAAHSATHVVATGEGWRRRFIERWGVDPQAVTVVENGSELVQRLRRDQLRAFRSDMHAQTVARIAYVGGFEPWHGVEGFLRAVAEARAQGVLTQVLLIGSGSRQAAIEDLVALLGLRESVVFTGYLSAEQLAPYLADADIGVSPYCGRAEYSGLKLLDYKAAGLATIAAGEHGDPAIIEHGRTGWIVPPCDVNAWSRAIAQLSADRELRTRLGREARLEAERLHGWNKTAEALDELFQQVVGGESAQQSRANAAEAVQVYGSR